MTSETDRTAVSSRTRTETFIRHIEQHEELASTNDRALELAADGGLPLPAIVLAERQTSGRGRGSNVWQSGPGALTFSLVVERPSGLPRERMSVLSLAAGLAVRDAVAAVVPGHAVKVKWPNDVYLDGRKVCGILTEVPSAFPDRAVVGIGLNVNNSLDDAPDDVRRRAVSIAETTGHAVDAAELLVSLLVRLESEVQSFADQGGVPVARWAAHCLLTDRQVRLRNPAGEVTGLCLGVSDEGALLLDGPNGMQAHRAGEVIAF
ncbi:MAG: biotin--[acetyl-CoA-carboxylase] ligase [Planctomycetaceae bacterium]